MHIVRRDHFPSRDKDGGYTIGSTIPEKPMLCKSYGSVFYKTGVMSDQSLHCGNKNFGCFRLLWPWPWPDDLRIRTWPVLLGDILDVQIRTSYVKAFESYLL